MALVMTTLLLLLGCPPGPDDTGTSIFPECRTEADCTDNSSCFSPDACNVGFYTSPTDECVISADCGEDRVCQPIAATCGTAGYLACADDCSTRGCAADEECDAPTGICAPWSCESGYPCPSFTTCLGLEGDANGCARDTCARDEDCATAGYCVGGACFDTLGTCTWAVP